MKERKKLFTGYIERKIMEEKKYTFMEFEN